MKQLIDKAGGQSAFARLAGIPLRTVQNWAEGKRRPPEWLPQLIRDALAWRAKNSPGA